MLSLQHKTHYKLTAPISNIFEEQNISTRAEYSFTNLNDKYYLEILLIYTYKYDKQLYMFNKHTDCLLTNEQRHNNFKDLVKSLIHEFPKYDYPTRIRFLNLIIYYADLDTIQHFYNNFPRLFDKSIYYNYQGKGYNFMKSAMDSRSMEKIHWLCTKLNFSFWENNSNFYNIKKKEDIKLFKEIIIHDTIKINDLYIKFEDYRIINTFVDIAIKNEENQIIKDILIYCCKMCIEKSVKYILKKNELKEHLKSFTFYEWYLIVKSIHYDDYLGNYKIQLTEITLKKIPYIKSRNVYYIIKFVSDNYHNFEEFVEDYINKSIEFCETLYINISKLPNIIPSLELLKQHIDLSNSEISSYLTNVLRYGTYETVNYFISNLDENIQLEQYKSNELYQNSILNNDNRIMKMFIKHQEFNHLYNSNDCITEKFLQLKSMTVELKIKKLQIISKYNNLDTLKYYFSDNFHIIETKIDTIKLEKWILKKVFDNDFNDINESDIKNIFRGIIKHKNLEYLKYFLKLCKEKLNQWEFVIMALNEIKCSSEEFNFHNPLIKKLIRVSPPLKCQSEEIKTNLLWSLDIYEGPYIKDDNLLDKNNKYVDWYNQKTYDELVKYLLDNNVNLNSYNYSIPYIKHVLRNCSSLYFKSLILNGVKFGKVYEEYVYNKYFFYWGSNNMNAWIKMYILIKRLEFRKYYKQKKYHNYIYKSSIIDLINRPPKPEKPVLKNGGIEYYRVLDNMDTLYEEDNIKFYKPVHSKPHNIIELVSNEMYVAQKIDGILHKNINKDLLFPSIPEELEDVKLDGEYIPELNLHIIFGIRSNSHERTTYIDDYEQLQNSHSFYSGPNNIFEKIDTEGTIRDKINHQFEMMLNFCSSFTDKKHKWWPQKMWKFEESMGSIQKITILELLELHQNKIFQEITSFNMMDYIQNEQIMTDGLILMNNKKQVIYKLKPKRLMTADLKINGQIMRCYYDDLTKEWIPKQIREDKKYPNPQYVVDYLEQYHKNPWTLNDLKQLVHNYYQKNSYQNKFVRNFCSTNKINVRRILDKIDFSNKKVLDLGCGYFNNPLWTNAEINITGLDVELKLISEFEKKYRNDNKTNSNKQFILSLSESNVRSQYPEYDISKLDDEENKLDENFNVITSFMSIHNFFQEKYIQQLTSILEKVVKGTHFIVSFLDDEMLLDNISIGESYVRRLKEPNEIDVGIIKYYYSFRHNEPVEEPIISKTYLTNYLNKLGFQMVEDLDIVELDGYNPWNHINDLHTYMIFTKK